MFRYPLEDNLFNNFFELLDGLLVATDLNKLVQMKMCVDKYERIHIATTDSFSRAIKADVTTVSQKQTDLVVCESYLIRLLAYVYEYKLQEVTNHGYVSGVLSDTSEFIEPEKLINRSQSSFILSLHLYIAIIARVISVNPKADYDKIENLAELVKHSCEISRMILSFDYSLDAEPEEISNVTPAYMQMLRRSINITSTDKKDGDNCVEASMRKVMKIHVDQLMLARARQVACVDDYKTLRIVDGNWQYASQFLTRVTKDHILQIDMLASFYNLSDYKEFRALYDAHLKRHCLRDEYFTDPAYLHQNRITVVSGLVTKNSTGDELEIAAVLLQKYLCKVYEIFEVYLHLKNSNNDVDLINNILLQQVEAVRFDASHLIYFAARCSVTDKRARTALQYFQMTAAQSAAILYAYDKVKYRELGSAVAAIRGIDIRFNHMFKWAKGCLFTLICQSRLQIQLDACKDDEARLKVFECFILELKLYITNFHQLPVEDNVRINAALFIIDLYVMAMFECRNLEEYFLLKDSELHGAVFDLGMRPDNKPIYEFLLLLAGKLNQPGVKRLPLEQVSVSDMYLVFIEKLFVVGGPALMKLFKNEHRPCVTVGYLFAEKARAAAKCVAEHSVSEEYRKLAANCYAVSDVSRANLHSSGMQYALLTAPSILTYMPPAFEVKVAKPKADVSASFLEGLQSPRKTSVKQATKKKKNKNAQPAANQYYPKVTDDIELLKNHFKNNYHELYDFFFKALHKRDAQIARCSLLGCANTLYLLKDRAKAAKLAVTLMNQANMIQDVFKNSSYESTMAEFEKLIKPWRPTEESVKRKPKSTPTPAPQPQPVPVVVTVKRKTKAAPTLFNSPVAVKSVPSAVQKTAPKVMTPVKVVEVDLYEGLRIDRQLPIVLTVQQSAIIEFLKKRKADPMAHGGTVIDLLFGIKPRDLDLLCFAHITELIELLLQRKADFAISNVRKLKYVDVIVIEFDKDIIKNDVNRLSDYKLEILVLPPNQDKRLQIVNLARGFGVTFLLYDFMRNGLIDPVKLYSKLVDKHMLDIQPCAVDIDEYFKKFPGRMIDLLYRMAKFHSHKKPLALSSELLSNVKKNIALIQPSAKVKLSLEMFDKIFMQGFSCQFLLEFANFSHTEYLIPNINAVLFPAFIHFCVQHDVYIQQHENLSLQEFEQVRTAFFVNGFYDAFMLRHHNDIQNYRDNDNQFYRDSATFLANSAFDLSHDTNSGVLINSVQNEWWERIQQILNNKPTIMRK